MKKHLAAFGFILAMIFLSNCGKENVSPKPLNPNAAGYFMPLKIGNFWVYKVTIENGNYPNYTYDRGYDTVRISSDTTINGNHYFEIKSKVIGVYDGFYADSAGWIVRLDNSIYPLSLTPNDTVAQYAIGSNFLNVVEHTGVADTVIQVPAGVFRCIEMIGAVYYVQDTPPAPNTNPRQSLNYYSENIGLTKCKTFFVDQPGNIIVELQSYFIQH